MVGVKPSKCDELFEFDDANNMTSLQYTNTLYGYRYGVTTPSWYLSLAVLSVYCLVTILYLRFGFFTGLTSTAWSSTVEFAALALQSSKSSVLGELTLVRNLCDDTVILAVLNLEKQANLCLKSRTPS